MLLAAVFLQTARAHALGQRRSARAGLWGPRVRRQTGSSPSSARPGWPSLSRALARRLIEQHAGGDGCVQAFHRAGAGNRDRASACAANRRHAVALIANDERNRRQQGRRRSRPRRHRSAVVEDLHAGLAQIARSTPRRSPRAPEARKMLPAEARTALGFHALTVPGRQITPSAPKASAERRIVPRLPGSCRPASTTISGAACCCCAPGCAPRSNRAAQQVRQRAAAFRWQGGVQQLLRTAESRSPGAELSGFEQVLGALRRKDAVDPQTGPQGLFEQVRPLDTGQAPPFAAGDGQAPGAVLSGGHSAYSVQCEQASYPSCNRFSRFYAVLCRASRCNAFGLNLHRGRCCDSFRLYGVCKFGNRGRPSCPRKFCASIPMNPNQTGLITSSPVCAKAMSSRCRPTPSTAWPLTR